MTKRIPPWLWAAASALLAFAVYTTWRMGRLQKQMVTLSRQTSLAQQRGTALDSERERYQQALAVIAAADTKRLEFEPANPAMPPIAAYWNPRMGLVLASENMPATAPGRTLQLWALPRQGGAVSVSIFRPAGSGHLLVVIAPNASIRAAKSLEITEEPVGGSVQPGPPAWSGPLG